MSSHTSAGTLRISQTIHQILLAHLQTVYPLEGCGLLAGQSRQVTHLYAIHNVLQSPVEYEMAPLQQLQAMLHMEEAGQELLAIYHSHPDGPERPSPTDIARAFYPDVVQLIVSLRRRTQPIVGACIICDGVVRKANLEIIP